MHQTLVFTGILIPLWCHFNHSALRFITAAGHSTPSFHFGLLYREDEICIGHFFFLFTTHTVIILHVQVVTLFDVPQMITMTVSVVPSLGFLVFFFVFCVQKVHSILLLSVNALCVFMQSIYLYKKVKPYFLYSGKRCGTHQRGRALDPRNDWFRENLCVWTQMNKIRYYLISVQRSWGKKIGSAP